MNNAMNVKISNGSKAPVCRYQTMQAIDTIAAIAFNKCPPGNLVAADVTLPANFP
jgi:hypothetical protein